MGSKKSEPIDYLTLLGYVKALRIKLYNPEQIESKFSDFELLGSGNSVNVYRGNLVNDPNDPKKRIPVAIKIPKANIKDMARDTKASKVLSGVRQELRMMKHFETHPNIINLYGVLFEDLKPCTIVEIAEDSITEYLSMNKEEDTPIDWETKARFCCEVADGLQALHAARIVHGDLKGDNILLFKDHDDKLVAKITDFGYSTTTASIESGSKTGGSLNFMAPECTKNAPDYMREYESKPFKDKYTFGLFVWQVARDGEIPYDGMSEDDMDNLKHSDVNLDELMKDLEEDTPHYFRDVITAMAKYAPEKREDLTKVREMMKLDDTSNASHTIAEENLELYARELPRNIAKADLSSIELMSISSSLKTKIYRDYENAAADGDAKAMFMIAICYSAGFAVEVDKKMSLEWCIKAADAGSLNAIFNIAENYDIRDLPVEAKAAFPWYIKAAEEGSKHAAYEIHNCYSDGIGVEKDKQKSEYWYNMWLNMGHTSEAKMNINITETSLHRASRLGDEEATRYFLKQKSVDVNAKNNNGQTALHIAAQSGHTAIVKLLMMAKADINAKDKFERTPLELAAGKSHVNIVQLLANKKAVLTLNLADSGLGDSEVHSLAESLKAYATLTQLSLERNRISDDGVCALAGYLKQNSTLTELRLQSNNVSDKGAFALAECLKQNSTLVRLDLKDNKIGDEGACTLAESLKQNSTLARLELENNKIDNKGSSALEECMKQNSALTILV